MGKELMPIIGSTRVVRKFLYTPKKLKHQTKWFQYALIKQQYMPYCNKFNGGIYGKWQDISFLN
jgi:hypothetical protein